MTNMNQSPLSSLSEKNPFEKAGGATKHARKNRQVLHFEEGGGSEGGGSESSGSESSSSDTSSTNSTSTDTTATDTGTTATGSGTTSAMSGGFADTTAPSTTTADSGTTSAMSGGFGAVTDSEFGNLAGAIAENEANPAPSLSAAQTEAALNAASQTANAANANTGLTATNGMTMSDLSALQAAGLGSAMINDTQNVDQAIASLGLAGMTPAQMAAALSMVNPALGKAAQTAIAIADLLSGKVSIGATTVNAVLGNVASKLNVPVGLVTGVINGNPGQAVSSSLTGAITSDVAQGLAQATGLTPGQVSGIIGLSGVTNSINSGISSGVNNALGVDTSGQTNTASIGKAIDGGVSSIGSAIGIGGGSPTGNSPASTGQGSSEYSGANSITGESGSSAATLPAGASSSPLSSLASSATSETNPFGAKWLDSTPQILKAASMPAKPVKLAEIQQLYKDITPEMREVFAERGIPAPDAAEAPVLQEQGALPTYLNGGEITSLLKETQTAMDKLTPKFSKTETMLAAAPVVQTEPRTTKIRHLYDSLRGKPAGMAQGGLPSKYHDAAPPGHKPEFVTGLTGYYAQGGGTGQSDDIPAMLHDGDYVIDADAVAAFGDGSSKAGAEVLSKFQSHIPFKDDGAAKGRPVAAKIADGEYVFPAAFVTAIGKGDNKRGAAILDAMRENLRQHKRSAPTSKIPPKAKSPLDYLKAAKG